MAIHHACLDDCRPARQSFEDVEHVDCFVFLSAFLAGHSLEEPIRFAVLATVDRGDRISELVTKLDHSESYLSRAVADLVEKGLVYTERNGRGKRVVPSDGRAVERYHDLVLGSAL